MGAKKTAGRKARARSGGTAARKRKPLTTTSYAILGLLAIQDWTTYELAQQMHRSMRNFWPRAESKLYEEPKNLVAHGLARASRDRVGKRPRTTYSITAAGRRALRAWLGEPAEPLPVMEFESLIKVFLADHGTKDDLLRTIQRIRSAADDDAEAARGMIAEYLDSGGPFPERLHIIRLMARFLWAHDRATREWAAWAEREVAAWSGVRADDHPAVPDNVFRAIVKEVDDVGGD